MLVSHEASRTGAPKVALQTVEWLVKDGGYKVIVVARSPGPMLAEFKAAGADVMLEPLYWLRIILRRFISTKNLARNLERWSAKVLISKLKPRLVYLNSALSLNYAEECLKIEIPTTIHLHETGPLLEGGLSRYTLSTDQAKQAKWIACASQAIEAVSKKYPGTDALLWPSCVDEASIKKSSHLESTELPSNYVLGVGKANWGKGFDHWLRLCNRLARIPEFNDLEFVWLGELQDKGMLESGLAIEYSRRFHFLGELKNPYPVIKKARLLAVTSRAEASPLVTLEAQALGVPVVAFDVGDIKKQIPISHLVKADDEINLLQTAQMVLKSSTPMLKFDINYNGLTNAKIRTLKFFKQQLQKL